jgi:hypothetical protein
VHLQTAIIPARSFFCKLRDAIVLCQTNAQARIASNTGDEGDEARLCRHHALHHHRMRRDIRLHRISHCRLALADLCAIDPDDGVTYLPGSLAVISRRDHVFCCQADA